jgi:hypothetical protein
LKKAFPIFYITDIEPEIQISSHPKHSTPPSVGSAVLEEPPDDQERDDHKNELGESELVTSEDNIAQVHRTLISASRR